MCLGSRVARAPKHRRCDVVDSPAAYLCALSELTRLSDSRSTLCCRSCDPSPATSLPVLPETTDPPPKRYGPCLPIRSVPTNTRGRGSADDKIENEEVAPRVTPVAAARRSRPYPRAHPLLRIGDPSPYAPSPALPSVDPTVRRSYPLSSTSLNTA
jgi:hypothetical protein